MKPIRRRIVKITTGDKITYRCERTGYILRNVWRSMTFTYFGMGGAELNFVAEFDTLEEARNYMDPYYPKHTEYEVIEEF